MDRHRLTYRLDNELGADGVSPDPTADALREVGYNSIDEWKKATFNSRNEGKRLSDELAEREARLDALERVMPSTRSAARRDPVSELATLGIPVDALNEYVENKISGALAPLVKTNAAMQRVKAANPDFARFEPDWQQWLAANPDINRRLQDALVRDPDNGDLTIEGTFAQYARTRRASAPPEQPRETLPVGAGLPASAQGNPAGRSGELFTGPTQDQLKEMLSRARRGDRQAQIDLMRLRVGTQPHPELPKVG